MKTLNINPLPIKEHTFLSGGGEMGMLTRSKDWAETPVGPIELWPQSLRTTLGILLNSRFPMFLWWGPDLICFYNDAYRPSLGQNGKHPVILGQRAEEAWPEIWDVIKPLIDQVLSGGEATWSEDQLIPIYRNGRIEDVYWTFSYSPVHDESGLVAGVLVTCSETTEKINTFRNLEESKTRYYNNILQAPVAMCIFRGKNHTVEIANAMMLEVWDKTPEQVINKPVFEAIPEAGGQGLEELLDNVCNTGEKFVANERLVNLSRNGKIGPTYINFVYEALKEPDGGVSGIVAIASDVTMQVLARKKIEESEERFRTMAEGSDILIAVADESSNATYFNKAWVDLTGRPVEDLLKFGWADLIHPEDRESYVNIYLDAFKKREPFTGEFRVLSKEGTYHWLLAKGPPRFRNDGTFAGYISSCADVTDLNIAKQKIEESEKRFRTIADSVPVLIWMTGTDKLYNFFNKAWLHFTGRTMGEETGNGWETGVHPDDLQKCLGLYINAFDKREEFSMEYRLMRNDGEYRWISNTGVPRITTGGTFEGYIGACMDINERIIFQNKLKESEERLKESAERLTLATEGTQQSTWDLNLQTYEIIHSPRLARIFGHEDTKILSHSEMRAQIHPGDVHEIVEKAFETALRTGNYYYEARVVHPDKTIHWIRTHGKVIFDDNRSPVRMLGTLMDVTDSHVAEENMARMAAIVQSSDDAIISKNLNGIITTWNAGAERIFGYTAEEMVGQPLLKLIPPDKAEEEPNILAQLRKGQRVDHFETKRITRDNKILDVSLTISPVRDSHGNIIGASKIARDITEQKEAELLIITNEQKFRLLADSMPQFIWTGDDKGNLNYFNKAVYDYSGLTPEQIDKDGWLQIVHPDDKDENTRLWKESVTTGKDFIFEHRFRRYDGEYRWQLSRAIPQRGRAGIIQMWVGTSTDIQDIKEQDQQKDYFISMASHELKTPITSMKGYVQILQTMYANTEDTFLKKSLDIIDKQIGTLTNLIGDLLDLSKIKVGRLLLKKEYFQLNELIEEVAEEIKHIHPAHTISFSKMDHALVYADRERISQVLINFLTNAIKYSPGFREVIIESRLEGTTIVTSVKDFGIGIGKNDQEKIFERFYRVEGKNEKTFPGFGIGLFIAAEIVSRHDGKIGVSSEPGKGSVFYFSLPCSNP